MTPVSPGAGSPEPVEAETAPGAGGASLPPQGVILLLGDPDRVLPSSSCYLEILFPDGARTISDQAVQRDATGRPRAMQITYSQIAPDQTASEHGG